MTTAPKQNPRARPETEGERLSALERDVTHLGDAFVSLSRRVDQGFDDLSQQIKASRTPIGAMSGWAAVLITLGGAVLWPQINTDTRHERAIEKIATLMVEHISDGHPERTDDAIQRLLHRVDSLESIDRERAGHEERLKALERETFGN